MTQNQPPFIQEMTSQISLNTEEQAFIIQQFKVIYVQRNTVLFDVGEYVNQLYFIAQGLVKLVYTDANGKEYILGFALENWWECDFGAFLHQHPTSMRLVAMEKTLLYTLSKDAFITLQTQIPQLNTYFLNKSMAGSYAAQQRILSLVSLDATTRYHQLLKQYPQWFQRIPKKHLATYLGVSRETLSRMLKR